MQILVFCKWKVASYSTLFAHALSLLFLNVVSYGVDSLLYLQRLCNLSMCCPYLHGYHISVNDIERRKALTGEGTGSDFTHFSSGPSLTAFFFSFHEFFHSMINMVRILSHISSNWSQSIQFLFFFTVLWTFS